MELSLTEAQTSFRDDVVAFLDENLPEDIKTIQKSRWSPDQGTISPLA